MASCPKCGRKVKRRNGVRKCKRCGFMADRRTQEITLSDGRKPINPIGTCFDSAGRIFVINDWEDGEAVLCHGIGIANLPGQEGKKISHAWIEVTDEEHGRVALDPIWGIAQPQQTYRDGLRVEFVKEYRKEEFMKLWKLHDFPGPYESNIMKLTK